MNHGRNNWPIVIGVAAGVLGGIAAGLYWRMSKIDCEPDSKLRDAADLLHRCRRSINDLEQMKADLDLLRQSANG